MAGIGCEHHVKSEVSKRDRAIEVVAFCEKGLILTKVRPLSKAITDAIHSTGYEVVKQNTIANPYQQQSL